MLVSNSDHVLAGCRSMAEYGYANASAAT